MNTKLNVLLVDDNEDDAAPVISEFERGGYDACFTRVNTAEDMLTALDSQKWDLVLADHDMLHFTGLSALKLLRKSEPDVPFIVVTRQIDEETAILLMKAGAHDYVMKNNLRRLLPAIQRELKDAENRRLHKITEAKLIQSEELFRTLAKVSPVGIFMCTLDGRTIFVNERWCEIAGLGMEEASSETGWMKALHPDDRDEAISVFSAAVKADAPFRAEHRFLLKDGTVRWVLAQGMGAKDAKGNTVSYVGTVTDITDLKNQQERLKRLNRALTTLNKCNEVMALARTEQQILEDACKVIRNTGGYHLAWIGFTETGSDRSLRPVAHDGPQDSSFSDLWNDQDRLCGPSVNAVRSKQTHIIRSIESSMKTEDCQNIATKYGCESMIALPLYDTAGSAFGVLTIYDQDPEAFAEQEVRLLEELAADLTFAIRTIHLRDAHDRVQLESQSFQRKLRQSLEDAVKALAATTELRDPYTAGHQQRVGELASCIAREMGLSEEDVHVVYLASVVHDVGKIHIPAEILAKPTELSSIEFELIKTHAEAGYEILKSVDFPWPIAEIVRQHHERIDGSGYPQGLKDSEILIEAKIIAVADVIEAISSHRPYRPGRGIAAALDQIIAGCGKLYDADVVAACVKTIRENNFEFSCTTPLQQPLMTKVPN